MVRLARLGKEADALQAEQEHAQRTVTEESERLQEAEAELSSTQEAQTLLQHVAQTVQQKAHARIASLVSRCLEAIFDAPYQFKITFERKRGKTEAVLSFERGGFEVDPMHGAGGGVVNVAAFALRLASLLLARPAARLLLVLDEPFGALSVDYVHRVRELLLRLSEEFNLQMIIVTHNRLLNVGKVIELEGLPQEEPAYIPVGTLMQRNPKYGEDKT